MQFDIRIAINRYFPAVETIGFDLLSGNGDSRLPSSPPKIIANVPCIIL